MINKTNIITIVLGGLVFFVIPMTIFIFAINQIESNIGNVRKERKEKYCSTNPIIKCVSNGKYKVNNVSFYACVDTTHEILSIPGGMEYEFIDIKTGREMRLTNSEYTNVYNCKKVTK